MTKVNYSSACHPSPSLQFLANCYLIFLIDIFFSLRFQAKVFQACRLEYTGVLIDPEGNRGTTVTGTKHGVDFMLRNHQSIVSQFKSHTGIFP